ncbi:probable receptor-like protein kinase At1g67000 [Solanum tuberosum]|nr:PREDICTED: probable receptor-like protein kinase At1g67000 [Solanum tuberosum]
MLLKFRVRLMAAACFSAMFFMFHLLIFNLVKVESKLSCPKEFNCGRLGTMSYPFSEFNKPYCGLSKIDCNTTFQYPKVEIEGVTYNAYKKWLWVNGIDLSDSILESYLANRSCKSFERNLSFPDTPSITFGVFDNITLFKCMNGSTNEEIGGYFQRYEKYLNCDGFNLYYHKPRIDHRNYSIPVDEDDLPANCSIIRLPLKYISPSVPVPHDLFELLSSNFTLDWEVSKDCSTCIHREGQCQSDSKNDFFCSKAKAAKRYLGLILGIGSFAVFTCIGIVILLFCFREKILWYKCLRFWESNAQDHQRVEEFLKNYGSYAPNRYNYTDIKRITGRFRNKLGQGGFGNVYRGSLRDGSQVAVKVLNELNGSGEDFINEVASCSRTSHVNIVRLVGFCFEGHKRALIYEFMPNGSLEKFIYEERSDGVRQLGWPILYEISLGIARGLEYLHRGCNTRILHFDIKPHNILLDEDFCPKISDFGLAKLCIKKESIVSMLGPRGTIGYIAPEVVCRNLGGVSHKSDVYSYGMMVLEMVGGRKNVDVGVDRRSEIYFPHWLYRRIELDEELQLIGIMNKEENECARKMVIASLWCIQTDPANRPSMSKVVEMLEGKLDSLQMPPKPYLYSPSRSEVDSSNNRTDNNNNNVPSIVPQVGCDFIS